MAGKDAKLIMRHLNNINEYDVDDIVNAIDNIKQVSICSGVNYMEYYIKSNANDLAETIRNDAESLELISCINMLKSQPSTMVFTVFVSKFYQSMINEQLMALGQSVIDRLNQYDWDAKMVTVDAGRFVMVDLIISRIKQPQLIFLSYPLVKSYKLFDENTKSAIDRGDLLNQTYLYRCENIGDYYSSHLSGSHDALTASQLEHLFNVAIKQFTADFTAKCIKTHMITSNFISGIVITNLYWLINVLTHTSDSVTSIDFYESMVINGLLNQASLNSDYTMLDETNENDVLHKALMLLNQQLAE